MMIETLAGTVAGHKPKILLIYANTGGGHLSAARAIHDAIVQRYPGAYEPLIINVSLTSDSKQVHMLYNSYNLMLKADPRVTKHGWRLLNTINVEKAIIPMLPRAYANIARSLEREQPDMIVSVHPILNHTLIAAMKKVGIFGKVPYCIVCTDMTNNFLRGWANPEATRFLTFTEVARQQMINYGITPEKVKVLDGFPVNPSFSQDKTTKAQAREMLGLAPETFTILISIGGMAIPQKTRAVVRTLLSCGLPLQILVICGMNQTLKRQMHYLVRSSPLRIHVHGFTQRLGLMMTASDLMISKPGPGTIQEAIIKELPLLLDNVTEPMPQEKGNLEFALFHGIALKYTKYPQVPRLIGQLMNDRTAYERMQAHMRRIKNEQSIFEIADALLAELPQ